MPTVNIIIQIESGSSKELITMIWWEKT